MTFELNEIKLVESACSLGKQSLVSKPHATAVPTQRTESPGGALPQVRLPAFVASSAMSVLTLMPANISQKPREQHVVAALAARSCCLCTVSCKEHAKCFESQLCTLCFFLFFFFL